MNKRTAPITLAVFLALAGATLVWCYVLRTPELSPAIQNAPPQDQAEEPETKTPAPAADVEWNTYHGDSALLGAADSTLPEKLALMWRLKAGAPVRQTPVVHDQRILFVTSRGEVMAADFDGARLWSKELLTGETQNEKPVRERIDAPIAVFAGMVFAGSLDGALYALDEASGEQKWRIQLEGPIRGSVNYLSFVGGELFPANSMSGTEPGRLYVIRQSDGVLHCLDAQSGNILWRAEAVERCDGSLSVSTDAIVFGSCAAALHVFASDTGKLLRKIDLGEDSQVAGGVALDGAWAITGCRNGKVIQADVKTGAILWTNSDSQSEVFATPAVTREWVVVSSNDGNVYGLERQTGKTRWRFDTKGTPSSPVIASDKVVIAADGELFLLRLSDGAKLGSFKVSDDITSPALAQNMVLVGSEDGTVAAYGPERKQEQ